MKDAGSRDNEHDTATRGDASEFTVRPLPLGHRLGELQLDEVLGIGGFGIVYRAFDRTLRRAVAIKEYMPSMLATRGGDYTVSLRSERFAQAFDAGRGAFLNEARLLAQFDHPGLVKVLHFWESHGTAYMVMPFYEGRTLKQLLDGGMRISETQLRNIVGALLGALDTLHRAQCFHRDVALDNVLIRPNGSAILLDFGAARKRIGDLVDDGAMMIKPGYAPIEQYTDDPAFSQGPWTDLYALGAVMHAMITGELPPAAVVRSIKDTYRPLASRELPAGEVYSPAFLAAVDHALQLRIPDRPESVAAFAAELGLRDFDRTGSGYGAPAVPPVGDPGRGGGDKGAASVEAGTASVAAATSIGAGGTASGSAAPPTQAGAGPVSTPTDTVSASPGVSDGKPETDDVSPTLKAATHGAAATAAAGALAASAAHASRPAAKPVESDAPNGDVERAKEPSAARTDPHDETGARSARPDTDIGARGAAGSAKADAFAAEGAGAGAGAGAASTTAPYPAASSSASSASSASSGGASVPPGAQHSQAPAGSRKRRLPVYAGGAVVALIAVGLAATYLSRPARVADEPAPVASQPQAGTSPPASAPAATLAQQGPTPIVVPPSSLPAGSSAQVPPPRVAAEPASTPAVEAAPQVATTVTNTAPPPAGASPAIAPAGSLDASERVVNVPPSEAAVPPVSTPSPAPKPPDSQTAVAAVNALPAEQQPRAPKAQETVQVRFNVRPWGDVYVNGARRGASPPLRSVSLTPGVYVIEIRNGSLPPLHRTVAIDFGSKPVNIDYAFE
ncbi:serine/threonine protein kinase [Burkholderia cepacia]|uniref:serine/threonine-protein kinase n=3 Tax=Burkholderia cepacia TaxID=292 RepID=UPI00106720A4|nr:serine/threonine-protein kinase [Burkholderia cepacia]TES82303.1 serine/threonine protein kinase [Burkholderia cepacia]TET02716.1 serine/threonine protein kinase [Burkholderia cepacia]TEU39231.1 serine/threonine protein kinase [Burkholderia cepacia]TEU45371.1 serine/threonine protein kinase [Burkholderia cepacia]TEU75350.1 serine/threonine protein kinase [Burkholderia cepacia]